MTEHDLSARLRKIADMAPAAFYAADVGCDHGYVPILLLKNEKCGFAVASDLRPEPLKRAEAHIREEGLEEFIFPVQSDGLRNPEILRIIDREIRKRDPEAAGKGILVIAGMGGPLMRRILTDLSAKKMHAYFGTLLLSPQSDAACVRQYLEENGWAITEEEMLLDCGKYYVIIKAEAGAMPPLTRTEADYGPLLIKKMDPVFLSYLEKRLGTLTEIRRKLEPEKDRHRERILEVEEEIAAIREMTDRRSR